MQNERGAEEFGEFAGGVAAQHIHLPEAVLSGDVALGEEQIVDVGCLDVGYAVGVAADGDGCGESAQMNFAVELRKRGDHGVVQPREAAAGED